MGQRYPSYLNRRVSVPGTYTYFQQEDNSDEYKRWGRYENNKCMCMDVMCMDAIRIYTMMMGIDIEC